MPQTPTEALGRAGYPSRDSVPSSSGVLPGPRQSAWRVPTPCASHGGQRVRGPGVREGVAGRGVARPRRGRHALPMPVTRSGAPGAGPNRISPGRVGGKIQSGARQSGDRAIVSPCMRPSSVLYSPVCRCCPLWLWLRSESVTASSDVFSAAAARDRRVRPEQPIFVVFVTVRALGGVNPCAVRGNPAWRIRFRPHSIVSHVTAFCVARSAARISAR